jgi:hypothetical protein
LHELHIDCRTNFLRIGYLNIALGNGEISFAVIDDLEDFPLSFAYPRVFYLSVSLEVVESAAVDDDVVSAA